MTRNFKIKTNGYKITKEHAHLLKVWCDYIYNNFDVKYIDLFYYGDRVITADVILNNKNYGSFIISKSRVSLCGYTCSHEELSIFESATYRDEICNGKIEI